MIKYTFSTIRPDNWDEKCLLRDDFFNSHSWQSILHEGFKSYTLYAYEENGETSAAITVFQVGPFKIGYLNFPIGGAFSGKLTNEAVVALCQQIPSVHILRIPVSPFDIETRLALEYTATPETCITDLSSWNISKEKKFKRAVKRARKSELVITDCHNHFYELYKLYEDTILKRGGATRYTEQYFQSLLRHEKDGHIKVFVALIDKELAGYVVIARHRRQAYYLHGATSQAHTKLGASDLLFYEAILWAQESGLTSFNFMSSPPSQKGLIRFKEKLGGETRLHKTYEVPINRFYAGLFHLAISVYNIYGRIHHYCTKR